MPNLYKQLRDRQEKEFNAFPIAFAFDDKQFEEGMKKLGLHPSDEDKVLSINLGGFIRKSDAQAFGDMLTRHEQEFRDGIAQDESGEGFILDMFTYELANHEFDVTADFQPAFDALGITVSEVLDNPKLWTSYKKAKNIVVHQSSM